jgi:hypothetical protein
VLSLVRHASDGTLTSVSGFSASLARNVEQLSATDLYSLQREIARRRRPTSLASGVYTGVKSLSQSIVGGLVGVVTAPVHGAARHGVWGFVRGVGIGFAGMRLCSE